MASPLRRKLVIVGDGMRFPAVLGHTNPPQGPAERLPSSALSLSESFPETTNQVGTSRFRAPLSYSALAVFDNYVAEIRLDDKPVQLALWDTAGQEEYERLRPMSYSKSHVILIAFALDTPDSLENVQTKACLIAFVSTPRAVLYSHQAQWIEEVRSICGPTIPVILVGCKADLRPTAPHPNTSDNPCPWVTREQGERIAQAIGARAYKECSALKIEGVDEVFEAATRASMLMRDGVPGAVDESRHHRRKSSGKVVPEKEESGGCCIVC
ncbi:Rho small monomeric GTPase [Mycena kentingensis (nom. inval.)]|nr:Rho small monomeric GTPase [Mycena kentingensis (nom. inval.)]